MRPPPATKFSPNMPSIKRTTQVPGKPDAVEVFYLPHLKSNIVGRGVNGRVLSELRKRGRSEVEFESGEKLIFEIEGNNAARI